ncbi:hypothetical protein XI08_10275 [Bradyrhizobium sp. CCBAU 11361]|nr:hypothetical protein [Bradyrhizobium sp. CCBAU 11361]
MRDCIIAARGPQSAVWPYPVDRTMDDAWIDLSDGRAGETAALTIAHVVVLDEGVYVLLRDET